MRTRHKPRVLAVVAVAAAGALALGACSSDAKDNAAAQPPATTTPTTMTAQPDAATSAKTIVDIAAGNKDFSTLVTAVKAAGLATTLSGAGPYTVFAPTNAAFDKLPAGTVATLLKPANKQQLTDVLTYHVVPGKVMAADVKPGKVTTVNGADFTIGVEGGDVVITDGQGNKAKVVATDIEGSNGVIHVIDHVLLPPSS